VYTAVNTPAFFDALQAYTTKVVQAGHQASHMISFWSSITVEAVFGMLENTSSGRREVQSQKTEELVLRVLPVLNTCMRAKYGAETVAACYAIVTVLVGRGELGDKVLDGLMEAVVLAHDDESLNACLQCLAVIAEQRAPAQIPNRVHRGLLAIPQFTQKLVLMSKQCRVQRLALGCALGALAGIGRSDDQQQAFQELMASNLLNEPQTQTAISALIGLIQDHPAGSEERGKLLEVAAKLAETTYFMDAMRAAAKASSVDLDSLGLSVGPVLALAEVESIDFDDEDMLDIDDAAGDVGEALAIQLPSITAKTFFDSSSAKEFGAVSDAFEQAVTSKQVNQFLASEGLCQTSALQQSLYLSFLARFWCSTRLPSFRVAALRATAVTIKDVGNASEVQNLIPYLVRALADPAPIIRRSAATCIAAMSKLAETNAKPTLWGTSDMYGKASGKIHQLKAEEASTLMSAVLVPMLEESVMDATFAIPAIRDILEGSQSSKAHAKQALKAQTRTSILSFLASHASLTPLLRVRHSLFPIFRFLGKTSDAVRSHTLLPSIQAWCSLSPKEAAAACALDNLVLEDADQESLSSLIAREAKSVQLLQDITSGQLGKDRTVLVNAAFDQISVFWPAMKAEPRLSLAQSLLESSFKEGSTAAEILRRERAIEVLRNLKLDSLILVTFLDTVPSAVQMPEGPPAKKRRRTSRNEMARVELSSQDDVQRLLRRLTFVLELIEGSSPGQHPALFRSLFAAFGELQPLKQQSGSELVYLQSMILGSLTPIVDSLKQQSDTADYQSAVRADLLIDCIRHSTSPQVQNGALLLIANLASWVPELILHNLMPIFTFIGSTLLRQQDDYSAQVVDKVRLLHFAERTR
jgi:U3 small nucleolar RNA-associated protein 10